MLSTEFWVQLMVYAVTFAAAWGQVTARLKSLEQKVEQHNQVIERTYRLEKEQEITALRLTALEGQCSSSQP